MTDWLKEAEQLGGQLSELRRDIHMHPEPGNREFRTSALLRKKLEEAGIEVQPVYGTALRAVLRGNGSGKTAALRADMDALPVSENTGLPFSSVNEGVMHACGHDFHMASLIGAARLLSEHRDTLNGNVVFLLQPDEEQDGGAEEMIRHGVLDGVGAVFGAHVNPDLPAGTVGIRYGQFYACAAKYDVTVHGKSCHGAEPEKGNDALYAACLMCSLLHGLTGNYDGGKAVVTTGTLHGGTVRNVVCETAHFSGIIRAESAELLQNIRRRFLLIVRQISAETGVTCDVSLVKGYPGVKNHDRETALVQKTAEKLLGTENIFVLNEGTLATEDFGCFLLERPGCYYHIGVNSSAPLHSPQFNPDERALACAAAVHAAVISEYLNAEKEK
ncbi:MAG: amidohydrolase [Solobacterium sp.]|nr:amidohydrolase [Solobacterium sp.]